MQQYFAYNLTTQELQLSIAQPSFSKMTTNKYIGNLTVKENFVTKNANKGRDKGLFKLRHTDQEKKIKFGNEFQKFEHYLQKIAMCRAEVV